MKTATIASIAVVALLLTGIGAIAIADNSQKGGDDHGKSLSCKGLTAGETLSIKGLKGHFQDPTNHKDSGNASANINFQVSTLYFNGCTLSITGGTVHLSYNSYSITGGTVVLNRGGQSGSGWGTTSNGSFLISVSGLRGNSTSARVGAVSLDLKTGTGEFLVFLHQ